MKLRIGIYIGFALCLLIWGAAAYAKPIDKPSISAPESLSQHSSTIWQCRDVNGCVATIDIDGKQRKVIFRKCDVINTDAGWLVSSDDGWVNLKDRSE